MVSVGLVWRTMPILEVPLRMMATRICATSLFNVGIKLLNGQQPTDIMEAMALSFNRQYIDIYSNSWGPPDSNGDTFEGPKRLAMEALKDGVHQVIVTKCH